MVLGLREEGRTRSKQLFLANAPNPKDHWTAYTNPSLDKEEEANKAKCSYHQILAGINQSIFEEGKTPNNHRNQLVGWHS